MDPSSPTSSYDPSLIWGSSQTSPTSGYSQQQQQTPVSSSPSGRPYQSPEPGTQSSKRSRISRACDTCRKKKIKCDVDNCHPCTTCKQYGWECTFNDTARKRGPPKGYIEGLEARLKRMEQLLSKMQNDDNDTELQYRPSVTTDAVTTNIASATSSPAHSAQTSPHSAHATLEDEFASETYLPSTKGKVVRFLGSSSGLYLVNDMLKNKEKDGESAASTSSTTTSTGRHGEDRKSNDACEVNSSLHNQQQYQQQEQQPRAAIANHHLHKSATCENVNNFTSLETKQGTFRMGRMNGFDDDLVVVRDETEDESRIQAVAANEQETMDSIIPRSMLSSLVNIYFESHCTTLPILDKEEFVNAFEGKTSPPPSPLLTYAVCSYSCFLVPSSDPLFTRSGLERNEIFHALMDRAGMLIRSEYLTPRIQTIQALILLCAHPTYSSGSYRNWILAGMAVRMAQDLGLHRIVTACSSSKDIQERRRRLWYAVYLTDRWCCSAMGRPLAIADSDCDVDLPDVDAVGEPGKYTMFVNLVKLSGILGEVLRRIYSPKAKAMGYGTHIMEQTVWSLDKMLKEWFDNVPSECRITQEQLRRRNEIDPAEWDTLIRSGGPLTVCYYAVVVLIFRPFIVFECNHHGSRLFNEAPTQCMEAAKNAIDVARHIPEREIARYGWNFAAYSVFQASLIHVYNCTSNDPVVAQTARDYIRISIDESIAPMTKDIPYGPPVIQFLENLLHLMKADTSVLRPTESSNASDSSPTTTSANYSAVRLTTFNEQHSTSEGKSVPTVVSSSPSSSSLLTPSSIPTTAAHQGPSMHSTYPPSSSQFIPTSTGMTAPYSKLAQPTSSSSPMSVYQIVSGMEQPTVQMNLSTPASVPSSSSLPLDPPTSASSSARMPNNVESNPVDLITLALTQDSLLGNESNPIMTQATWQYLFSSAGTPFTNNANSGSEFQVSWENLFTEGQGGSNFTS